MVIKNDSEREYHVYLFERIILCCKEAGGGGKKGSKSNSILKKPPSKRPTSLQLKGRIFIANVINAIPQQRGTVYLLQVTWRGDLSEEHFSIKCRTEEVLRQWQRAITKAVEDGLLARRSRAAGMSTSSLSSMRRLASPLSQFPNTPSSEMGPLSASASYMPDGEAFYEDPEDDMRNRRPTQSLPASSRGSSQEQSRPRAQTEDSSSNIIHQWRSTASSVGSPALPSLPRGASMSSESMAGPSSLRNSASSRGLRSKPSTEWGNSAAGFTRVNNGYPSEEERQPTISRNASQASLPSQAYAQPPMRHRSASSPHIYQMPQLAKTPSQQSWANNNTLAEQSVPSVPPLNIAHKLNNAHLNGHDPSLQDSKRFSSSSNGTNRSSAASNSADSNGQYTNASSPASTVPGGSNTASTIKANNFRPPVTYSINPAASGPAVAVKVKVNFAEDTFAVVVLSTISYREMVDKVLRKIKMCGDRGMKVDEDSLRLRCKPFSCHL